jgi:hypothetical protein
MKTFRVFKQALQPLIKPRKNPKCSAMGGDCFHKAAKMILNGNLPFEHTKLVHGIVKSSKEGRDMHHAWNEIGDVVIDRSNGQNIIMRKEQYYKLGKIKQTKGRYASYDSKEMAEKLFKHKHWGPWDLDG